MPRLQRLHKRSSPRERLAMKEYLPRFVRIAVFVAA
jgi:hypothetical protein